MAILCNHMLPKMATYGYIKLPFLANFGQSKNCQFCPVTYLNPVSDVLEFDLRDIASSLQSLKPTKRNTVGFALRFYDPLGLLSPVIVTLKIEHVN